MNTHDIIHLVRQNLNRSSRELPASITERLKAARMSALDHQRKTLRHARLSTGWAIDFDDITRQAIGLVAASLIVAVGASYWHGQEYLAGIAEVDSEILADELPLGALVDKGFDEWLAVSEEQ
jgi:hypothetical protein